jgi:D-alanine-D-alanine ligase
MRIGLTYDLQTDPTDERQAEFDPPATLEAVRQALEALGHDVIRLGAAQELVRDVSRLARVELVVNLAEGAHGRCREAWVPTLLELAGVPYVGSDPLALSLGLDKVMAKRLAVAQGIPTPRWISVERLTQLPAELLLELPVIVKPRWEGSGRGIDAGAVVHTSGALAKRVRWLLARYGQPALVEEFLPAGELTVLVIGNDPPVAYPAIQRPLDPATRLSCHVAMPRPWHDPPPGRPWSSSDEPPTHRRGREPAAGGGHTRGVPVAETTWSCPLELDDRLDTQARGIALAMFAALGCRDMARVDLRVDAAGRAQFIEINPLPSVDPEGSLGLLAEHLGLAYADLIAAVLEAACRRLGRAPQTPRRDGAEEAAAQAAPPGSASCGR